MGKKYKDMTIEERKSLKAANEAEMRRMDDARNAAQASYIPPVVTQAEWDADHKIEQNRLDRQHRRSFAAGLDDLR